MRAPMSLRKSFGVVLPLVLLFILAIVTLILERVSRSNLYSSAGRDSRTGDYLVGLPDGNSSSAYLNINSAPTFALLGVIALVVLLTALAAFGIWELRKVEGTARHQRGWSWVVAVSSLVMVGASAGVFGYMTAVQSNESGWSTFGEFRKADREFTRETWACQVHKFYPGQEGWADTVCGTSTAARYLLLVMAVVAALILVSLWVLIRTRGGLQWFFGGKGRYAGFPSLYEMQPGAHAPYQPAPSGPQWVAYPVQQWPQPFSPGQQYAQQPYAQGVMQYPQQSFPPATQFQPQTMLQQPVTQAPNAGGPTAKRDVYV